ncbi:MULTISPECIES: GNAT family N-acetyltransferase [unclassified Enterococcus]|uniref:GNAT family N-acetyltransferase n=1 Tax=unclassified Enterococcus TaxID=2608891 RepID=UPI001CE0A9B1|nr:MULTISPECIES: GNAT family N-acetyltransferase [unclassified Enterococcus]MCA5011682.1 GNAT family N-acetyltransferase [Enterococcus sp. S23]MCA5014876.1 GNAT family N-acetyltransferase [Enterococcus sp. S22(2020)]
MATYLRYAQPNDLPELMEIIVRARQLLAEQKIPQWQNGEGPSEKQLISDISLGHCYVLVVDEMIVGLGVISTDKEPPYEQIKNGNWQDTGSSYAVIHRVALHSDHQGRGLALTLMNLLISAARLNGYLDIRIDTHPKNQAMQQLIKKAGFSYQGDILLEAPNGERYAYQLVLT